MPPKTGASTEAHDIVRLVRATRGRVGFRLDCQPRFNYGRDKHEVVISDEGVVFHSDAIDLSLAFVPGPQGTPGTPRSSSGKATGSAPPLCSTRARWALWCSARDKPTRARGWHRANL